MLRPSRRHLRQFAAGLTGIAAILAVTFWTREMPLAAGAAGAIAAAAVLLAIVAPPALRWLYVPLMCVALPVGVVVSAVLLAALYWLVLTPVALVQRAGGRDLLGRRSRRGDVESFWREVDGEPPPERYFRQF